MDKKILLFGSTGKMGGALKAAFGGQHKVICKSSRDFDAADFNQVEKVLNENSPDIVINTVAFLGIDPCEKDPQKAFLLNTLYPKLLAEMSNKLGFVLVHFSTDAVFNDKKGDYYIESDMPAPVNVYGFTKYGGDCFISAIAERYYIFRLSVLFGETVKETQFVEKMLAKVREGHKVLRVSDDIVSSPTYSLDAATEIKRIVDAALPYGLYHIANEGKASLYDFMGQIIETLGLDVRVEGASHKEFSSYGRKNTLTPIRSEKINPLRPWREALKDYCGNIKINKT